MLVREKLGNLPFSGAVLPSILVEKLRGLPGGIGILLPNNQRQHRTLHIQKDVLPYALRYLLCPVSAALASIFRMDGLPTPSSRSSQAFSGLHCQCRLFPACITSEVPWERDFAHSGRARTF